MIFGIFEKLYIPNADKKFCSYIKAKLLTLKADL